ncbi:MAG: hypothetical protein ACYCT2_08270 [Thermoplasmataceae archaeon]
MEKQTVISLVAVTIVILAGIFSFTFTNSKSTDSPFINSAPFEVSTETLWLFNGSFANYTGLYDGNQMSSNYSISGVNLSAGTYYVTTHIPGLENRTFKWYTNRPQIFPGANATGLSYFNSGEIPPWINRTIDKQFSVSTGKVISTKLGNYSADEIEYYAVNNINGHLVYINGTSYFDSYSGLVLKENLSTHNGNLWENESYTLVSTDVSLGNTSAATGANYMGYYIAGGVIAAAVAIGVGVYLVRRRH